MSALIVFCTCPDRASADALACALVEGRFAACVSLMPVQSVYRWKGAVEHADEVQLLVKTTSDRFEALREAVLARHPYELPELIAVEAAAGLDRYLDWIGASTRPEPDSSSA
jgi:periplasmic divalent cation tolerance protein